MATLFVPNGSDIVSAKGRGFPETLYRSQTEPVLNPNTRLTVLVNEQTASAAEIVTGAVQDLDVGVVVGKGRTFGKGLGEEVREFAPLLCYGMQFHTFTKMLTTQPPSFS